MRQFLFLLLPILLFSWDWIYSPKCGGIWTQQKNNLFISYIPDLGIREIYSILPNKPYCNNYKFFEEKYELIWDYPIKIAFFKCSSKTYIVLDEEIGDIGYIYREKILKVPKSKTIKLKGKKNIIYGKWNGDKYFIPTYTYLIK